jgi:hypothetical protein
VPLLPPRIGVARADLAVVWQVRAEEEASERERERKVREEEALRLEEHRQIEAIRSRHGGPTTVALAREAAGALLTGALREHPPLPRAQNMKPGGSKVRSGSCGVARAVAEIVQCCRQTEQPPANFSLSPHALELHILIVPVRSGTAD